MLSRKWHSFDRKLPLLASSLVLITAFAVVGTAYYHMERALIDAARHRLARTAVVTAQLLMRPGLRRETGGAADRPLVDYLEQGIGRAAVEALLRTPQVVGENKAYAALLDHRGRPVLEYRRDTLPVPAWPARAIAAGEITADSVYVSPFEPYGASAGYSRVRALRSARDSAVVGYLVVAYPFTSPTVKEFRDIVGGRVDLRVGRPGSSIWTDLERVVPAPAAVSPGPGTSMVRDSIVGTALIAGTGFVVRLTQPKHAIVSPLRSMLWTVIPLALGIAVLGAVLMWRMARNITRPLAQLTDVAEGVARDSDSMPTTDEMPATVKGGDEIVRLRFAFERMSNRVAERQSLEAQLRHSQKMEAIGRLAGGVAHDFNNLLTAIRSYVDLLLEDMPPYDPKRGDLNEIRRAADRAASLTAQLLAFGRKSLLQPRVIDTSEVLFDMQAMLRRLMIEDVTLRVDTPAGLWPVRADRGQLEQVIINLAVNARDAMPAGGALTIRADNVTLHRPLETRHGVVAKGEYVAIHVRDTGAGMDVSTQSRVFEPFFTTKAIGKGTGLGLATVHGIVAQSGGVITVDSEPLRGSTFTVYLPRAAGAAEPRTDATPISPARGSQETVLLVEDEVAVRALARRVLTRSGFRVLEATTPLDALRLAEEHATEVQLVLTDVVMPEMSGPSLVARLRAIVPGARALYISGYTDDEVISRGLGTSHIDLLQKPFSAQELASRVRAALDRPIH